MSIGIVGTGISGLQLALRLHQFGIPATVYAPQTPEDIRGGPPVNLVTRFGPTRAREEALGITHWAGARFDNPAMHVHVEAPGGPHFGAKLPTPASSVDFRLYLATLLEELLHRGGHVVWRNVTGQEELAELAAEHDLLVVAAGRSALTNTFPRDPARSPYSSPRRILIGGLFRGVEPPTPVGMSMHMVPGAGEIHTPPYHSFEGEVTAVLIEAVPDGPFVATATGDYRDEPERFTSAALELITEHAPGLRERVDERKFELTRPVDMLQGALTPVVREGWTAMGNGKWALAIGDAWIVNDPLTAQGANLGSSQAFEVADALRTHDGPYGEEFCRTLSERLWRSAQPVVDWTNLFIGEPPPQLGMLIQAAAEDQRVADAFVANLDHPGAMWECVRDPEHTAKFIANARSEP